MASSKEAGNLAFQSGELSLAEQYYSQALLETVAMAKGQEREDLLATLHCNRALVYSQMGDRYAEPVFTLNNLGSNLP